MNQHILYNAHLVQAFAGEEEGRPVHFGLEGIQWLDQFVMQLRSEEGERRLVGTVSALGAFYGECLIYCHGGEWVEDEKGWYVRCKNGRKIFPFAAIEKQLAEGAPKSILRLHDQINGTETVTV
jgi:hypothetical protein